MIKSVTLETVAAWLSVICCGKLNRYNTVAFCGSVVAFVYIIKPKPLHKSNPNFTQSCFVHYRLHHFLGFHLIVAKVVDLYQESGKKN